MTRRERSAGAESPGARARSSLSSRPRTLALCLGAALASSCLYGRYHTGLDSGAGAGGEGGAAFSGSSGAFSQPGDGTSGVAAGARSGEAGRAASSGPGGAAGLGGVAGSELAGAGDHGVPLPGQAGVAGIATGGQGGKGGEANPPEVFLAGYAGGGGSGQGGVTEPGLAGHGTGGSTEAGGATEAGARTGVAGGSGEPGGGGAAGGCEDCGEGNGCIDLTTSLLHCGACDRACATESADEILCEEGLCVSTCPAGRGNCRQPQAPAADNGCETNLEEDINNCGACGRVCMKTGAVDGVTCSAGRCVSTCLAGFANVLRPEAPADDDGCEVDLAHDPDHCGGQGRACSEAGVAERTCEDGLCTPICSNGYFNLSRPETPAADDGCEAQCPPSTGGPTMVMMPEGYCIDSTEVTRGQYQEWLDEQPPTAGQAAECTWNTRYEPTCDWPPETRADYPVVCVDWCDAYAYCAGVGKRLCGKIGGGATGSSDYVDASQSQWYHACVSGAADNTYPYGDSYEEDTCNGPDHGAEGTVPAGSLGDCQSSVSGYAGVYDLSGNAMEWEDACDGQVGGSDSCRLRGGSVSNIDLNLRCDTDVATARANDGAYFIGFRCCAP